MCKKTKEQTAWAPSCVSEQAIYEGDVGVEAEDDFGQALRNKRRRASKLQVLESSPLRGMDGVSRKKIRGWNVNCKNERRSKVLFQVRSKGTTIWQRTNDQ